LQLLNFFLTAMQPADRDSVSRSLFEVALSVGDVLFEPGQPVDWVYFPGSACVSVVTVMLDGKAVETATVGRESAVALLDAMTGRPSPSRVFVQVYGSAMRLRASAFAAQLEASPALLNLALRHARAQALQAEQGVACNVTHGVHARLARWLLMTHDRVGSTTFPLTQDYMAIMAGVQRTTISVAASELKAEGVIDYVRGRMTILDRPGLERQACECYGVVAKQYLTLRDNGGT
jgi:CRP-like cAMP-binding protein